MQKTGSELFLHLQVQKVFHYIQKWWGIFRPKCDVIPFLGQTLQLPMSDSLNPLQSTENLQSKKSVSESVL